jgi:hypothetical protein
LLFGQCLDAVACVLYLGDSRLGVLRRSPHAHHSTVMQCSS